MLRRHRQLRTQINQLKDTTLFAVALWLAHSVRSAWDWDIFGIANYLHGRFRWEIFNPSHAIEPFSEFQWLYVILIPAVPLILESQGFYDRPLIARRRDTAWRLFKGAVLTTIGVILATFFYKALLARGVILLFGAISFLLVFLSEEAVRAYYKRRVHQSQFRRKFVLIGSSEDTRRLRDDLASRPEEGIEAVGQIDLNEYSVERLIQLLHEHSATGIIINARHTYFGEIEKAIQACELEGMEAWLVADFFKTNISRTMFDELHGRPMLVFHSAPELSWQSMAKRLVDIVGSFLLLLLFGWNLFLIIALLIKRGSPGSILFRQKRAGLHGEPFTMLKFRTMVSNAEQQKKELEQYNEMAGPVFKVSNDPRITPIGRFLRRTSFDEWPQLWNVLKGEMSLVGPRPLPVDEVERFDDLAHRRRLSVKPGLTCLWQISGRNNVRDFRDWVRLDLEYIDNWSLWLDFKILVRTIPVVLIGTGAR
jgi:exopolysaccharide biosynthesis polyprenyl glycosylphosphotransferase